MNLKKKKTVKTKTILLLYYIVKQDSYEVKIYTKTFEQNQTCIVFKDRDIAL